MDYSSVLSTALFLTTAVYAWLTWKIAKESRNAADASRDAASAAQIAAEASKASAWIAEAQLPITFQVEVDRHRDGRVWFSLKPSVNLWIHGAKLEASVMPTESVLSTAFHSAELRRPFGKAFPVLLYGKGEGTSVEWPEPAYRRSDHGIHGFLTIDYSLAPESPVRSRDIYFESPEGLGERALRETGMRDAAAPSTEGAAEPLLTIRTGEDE
jgi:hypothetical protein